MMTARSLHCHLPEYPKNRRFFRYKPTDPQSESTFLQSKLDWGERQEEPHASMLAWYRDLVRLRRSRPELTDGRRDRVEVDWDEAAGWLVMRRGALAVMVSFVSVERRAPVGGSIRRLLLASDAAVEGQTNEAVLPPESVAIFEIEEARLREPTARPAARS